MILTKKSVRPIYDILFWYFTYIFAWYVKIVLSISRFILIQYDILNICSNSILSIFVWSYDLLNFVFMNVVILVILNNKSNFTIYFKKEEILYMCILLHFPHKPDTFDSSQTKNIFKVFNNFITPIRDRLGYVRLVNVCIIRVRSSFCIGLNGSECGFNSDMI